MYNTNHLTFMILFSSK